MDDGDDAVHMEPVGQYSSNSSLSTMCTTEDQLCTALSQTNTNQNIKQTSKTLPHISYFMKVHNIIVIVF